MNALWIVLRKELIDAFRDRRMVVMAFVVMPLAVPSLLAGMSAVGIRKQLQKLEATLELPVIGAERAPNLMAWLGSHNIRIVAAPEDPDGSVQRQEREAILRISPDYGARLAGGGAGAGRPDLRQLATGADRNLGGPRAEPARGLLGRGGNSASHRAWRASVRGRAGAARAARRGDPGIAV